MRKKERKGIVKVYAFFALNFRLHLAYTLQVSRNSLSKILDLPLYNYSSYKYLLAASKVACHLELLWLELSWHDTQTFPSEIII